MIARLGAWICGVGLAACQDHNANLVPRPWQPRWSNSRRALGEQELRGQLSSAAPEF